MICVRFITPRFSGSSMILSPTRDPARRGVDLRVEVETVPASSAAATVSGFIVEPGS